MILMSEQTRLRAPPVGDIYSASPVRRRNHREMLHATPIYISLRMPRYSHLLFYNMLHLEQSLRFFSRDTENIDEIIEPGNNMVLVSQTHLRPPSCSRLNSLYICRNALFGLLKLLLALLSCQNPSLGRYCFHPHFKFPADRAMI